MNRIIRNSDHLTKRQYRTLRKLIFLWIKTISHGKYKIFKNMILLALLISNVIFYNKLIIKDLEIGRLNSKHEDITKVLDLSLYPSMSYDKKTLEDRITYLYKRYIKDKEKPDHYYFDTKTKKFKSWWINYCSIRVRKMMNIQIRITDMQIMLTAIAPEKASEINKFLIEKRYEEIIADMSNYYAKFIPPGKYTYLKEISD